MEKEPTISVVLPCRDAVGTVGAAMASVQAQTWQDWELIAVDDGSADGSPDVMEQFARADGRMRVFRRPACGIVEALRFGCGQARGAFLARMDADDVALPSRLERQLGLLKANPEVGLCGCRVRMVGGPLRRGRLEYEEWLNGLTDWRSIRRNLFVECPVAHPAFLMRREAFEQCGGYRDAGWAEDYDLVLRIVEAGWELGNVAEVLLEWRESPHRLSRMDGRYAPEAFRALKRHFLWKWHLREGRGLVQWGAGEVGKRWLREWGARRPALVVDIDARKVGQRIHGVGVVGPESLGGAAGRFLVVAVGAPGARSQIGDFLAGSGWREGEDFVFVA
jgi:glycosyltransferase involved in cell wall biosynthesis